MPLNSQDTTWRVLLFAYAPVFMWLAVIFYLSSGGGSVTETSRIVEPVLRFLFPSADDSTIQFYHGAVRKMAHVAEYAVLAVLASRAFLNSGAGWLRASWPIMAIVLVSVTAIIDEFNQSFNTARTSSPQDVLIDISGGVAAVLILWLINCRRERV